MTLGGCLPHLFYLMELHC